MKTSDFNFDLPPDLIAQYPEAERGQNRLMLLNRYTEKCEHYMMDSLTELLCSPDICGKSGKTPLLVFNNSKVRKSRLLGKSLQSGVIADFLLLDSINENTGGGTYNRTGAGSNKWKTIVQKSKKHRKGNSYVFFNDAGDEITRGEITEVINEFRIVEFDKIINDTWLDQYGHIPLPLYIKRKDLPIDAQRYQTVYADEHGSAASPTAGLHFTKELMDRFLELQIEYVFITLHVGIGTFIPVRTENIEEHFMHEENYKIDEATASKIEKAKQEGRKIAAIGTTSLRTLESAWNNETGLNRGWGSTSIFIYPGYQFKITDILFTNFHTPKSTLLMLVSAFAQAKDSKDPDSGRELILKSYSEAISRKYRFFSYGDAMLIV